MHNQHPDYLVLRDYLTDSMYVQMCPANDAAQDATERLATEVNVLERALAVSTESNQDRQSMLERTKKLLTEVGQERDEAHDLCSKATAELIVRRSTCEMLESSNKLNRDTMVGYQLVAAAGVLFGAVGWFL